MHMHAVDARVKAFGFLSFGHYAQVRGSQTGSAADMIRQAVDLGVGADELGVNGAYFRVHHFAPQQAAPVPLLAAIAARTARIEVGTGVIDMRYYISGLLHWLAFMRSAVLQGRRRLAALITGRAWGNWLLWMKASRR